MRDANMVPQPKLDAAGKPVPYTISYPDKDAMGNFLSPRERRLGGRDTQLRLDVRAGHGGDPDPGGI